MLELDHKSPWRVKLFLKIIIIIMSVIIILLAASISIALLFLVAFILSVNKGQYDDEKSPPVRMLFDEKPKAENDEA